MPSSRASSVRSKTNWRMSGTTTRGRRPRRRCLSSSKCSIIGSGCIRRSAMSARCSSKPITLSPFDRVHGIGGSSECPRISPDQLLVNSVVLTKAKEKLQAHALEALLAALGTALPAWLLLAESRLVPYVSQLHPTTVIRGGALILVVALWPTALLLFFRPSLKFDPHLGIYQDRKSGLYFCPSCYSKKLRAPLREEKNGWRCLVKECRGLYRDPDYTDPSTPQRQSSWRVRN